MNKRVLIYIIIGIIVILTVCACLLFINKESKEIITHINQANHSKEIKTPKKTVTQQKAQDKHNLYSSDADLPYITLFEVSKMSSKDQEKVSKFVCDYQNAYIVKYNNKTTKLIIISPDKLENKSVFDRHNLEIVEVSVNDSNVHTMPLGFLGVDGETANAVEGFKTENESWEFDKNTEINRPLKHIVYNTDNKIEYEEIWNYNEKEPIKYEMKNGDGQTISILKETFTDETTYNQEHIFYDNAGQTDIIISIHYDGANITRLTYYNVKDKENGFTIISEYNDGIKIGEKTYDNDYALISDIKAEYTDGQISQLELLKNNQESEIIKK